MPGLYLIVSSNIILPLSFLQKQVQVQVQAQVLYHGMLCVEYNIRAHHVVCGMICLGYVPSVINNNNDLLCFFHILKKKQHDTDQNNSIHPA